jgi:hypothetical protein
MAAPAAATVPPLGVVLQAQRAHVDNNAAASGATVFDGDLLQTEHEGMLQVRFGLSQAYFLPGSSAIVHQSPDGFAANLNSGAVVLSSGKGEMFHLLANGATIQPAEVQPTVAQVTWVGPKELLLRSRKGALQVSLGDEVKTIPEGTSYRMVIDPGAAAAAGQGSGPGPQGNGNTQATGKNRFLFFVIGGAAVATGVGVALAIESPSTP